MQLRAHPALRTDTGTHSGVMCLSTFPARALPHDFASEVYGSARIQVVGLAVADTWVTVGLLYGLPCNARHKNARYQTDALCLSWLTEWLANPWDLVPLVVTSTMAPLSLNSLIACVLLAFRKFKTCVLGALAPLPKQLVVEVGGWINFGFPLNFKGPTSQPRWTLRVGPTMLLCLLPFHMSVCPSQSLHGRVLSNFLGLKNGLVLLLLTTLVTCQSNMPSFGCKLKLRRGCGLSTKVYLLPKLTVAGLVCWNRNQSGNTCAL